MKTQEIWIGTMPSAFGYGITAMGFSEKQVRDAMRKAYTQFKQSYKPNGREFSTFDNAMEYFGGNIKQVIPGTAYYDGFGE